jgi:Na+/phosphate symporter
MFNIYANECKKNEPNKDIILEELRELEKLIYKHYDKNIEDNIKLKSDLQNFYNKIFLYNFSTNDLKLEILSLTKAIDHCSELEDQFACQREIVEQINKLVGQIKTEINKLETKTLTHCKDDYENDIDYTVYGYSKLTM